MLIYISTATEHLSWQMKWSGETILSRKERERLAKASRIMYQRCSVIWSGLGLCKQQKERQNEENSFKKCKQEQRRGKKQIQNCGMSAIVWISVMLWELLVYQWLKCVYCGGERGVGGNFGYVWKYRYQIMDVIVCPVCTWHVRHLSISLLVDHFTSANKSKWKRADLSWFYNTGSFAFKYYAMWASPDCTHIANVVVCIVLEVLLSAIFQIKLSTAATTSGSALRNMFTYGALLTAVVRTYAKVALCVNFPWQAGTATHSENSDLETVARLQILHGFIIGALFLVCVVLV